MMIYGDGVSSMYGIIVDGRRSELLASRIPDEQRHAELSEFSQMIKHCKRNEFEEWYQLYYDTVMATTGTRKKKK